MAFIRLRHIVPLLAALLIGGCRDRFLSTSHEDIESPPPSRDDRLLYTDLNRRVVVSMSLEGERTDVVPTAAQDGSTGSVPLLLSPPRGGMMGILRKWQDSVQYTIHRLDGSIPDRPAPQIGVAGKTVENSFALSGDGEWFATFVAAPDTGTVPATVYSLKIMSLTRDYTTVFRTSDGRQVPISAPCFSPVGDRLAFLDIWEGFFLELVTVNTNGTGRKTWMSEMVSTDTTSPRLAWSPDGARVAVAGVWGGRDLITIAVQATEVLTYLPIGAYSDPRGLGWSPDGKTLVFSATPTGSVMEDLLTLDVATGAVRNITNTPSVSELAPQWSPDGRRIAYVAAPGGSIGSPAVYDRTLGDSRVYDEGRTSAVFWAR